MPWISSLSLTWTHACRVGEAKVPGPSAFIPSSALDKKNRPLFAEPMPGYVFTTRDACTGYYLDGPKVISLAAALGISNVAPPPLRLSLYDFLFEELAWGLENSALLHSVAIGPNVNADLLPRRSRVPEPTMELPTELHLASVLHREKGWWAIDTVNGNAFAASLDFLKATSADVALLQEGRVRASAVPDKEQVARNASWNLALSPCAATQADRSSAGVAVATRAHIGLPYPAACNFVASFAVPRFTCKRAGICARGGIHVASIYLHDACGIQDPRNLDLLQEAALSLSMMAGPWVIGGDWNASPQELADSGWLKLTGGVVVHPRIPTCTPTGATERILDYFVVSHDLAHAVRGVCVLDGYDLYPHRAVRLMLSGKARCDTIWTTVCPKGFPACLPHGPDRKPVHDTGCVTLTEAASVDSEYSAWLSSVEAQLSAICNHTNARRVRHAGRVSGPRRCRVSAIRHVADDCLRFNAVTGAWANTLRWIKGMEKHVPSSSKHNILCWRVLSHPHVGLSSVPDAWVTHAEAFHQWRSSVTIAMLREKLSRWAIADVVERHLRKLEATVAARTRDSFQFWLHSSTATSARRQHRMSRCATGWTSSPLVHESKSTSDEGELPHYAPEIQVEELSVDRYIAANVSNDRVLDWQHPCSPASAQDVVDLEAATWSKHWRCTSGYSPPSWPVDLGSLPPITLDMLKAALLSFPPSTGLAWDALHPRALLRLPDVMLLSLISILTACEKDGIWPASVAWVTIALLRKDDGGFRPIGLIPLLPRIWMRTRRSLVAEWEKCNMRSYLYAGPGRGADSAAWKQAARAEAAKTIGGHHGMVLLDLMKAFENICHHVLVREAIALGYPLAILRLALATYRLWRSIRIGDATSELLQATVGVTAGSVLATSEMRLVLIRLIDAALLRFAAVIPTVFVDDISSEAMHRSRDLLCQQLVGFNLHVCESLHSDGHIVSRTKSVCCASDARLGASIRSGLAKWGVKLMFKVKSLGGALASGARRNAKESKKRLSSFVKRRSRFYTLARAGASASKLVRTGGLSAITYGAEITGVSNGHLLRQRQTVARFCSLVKGVAGQNLDLALALADGVGKGVADPAFDAHTKPIVMWAKAIWEKWFDYRLADRYLSEVRADLLLATVPWARAFGPAAAFVLSVGRLGWTIHNALAVTTDDGRLLHLDLDPPIVVKHEVIACVSSGEWDALLRPWRSLCLLRP